VLKAAVDANMTWLALAGAVASVIGAFYYLRIVYFHVFRARGRGCGKPHGPGAVGADDGSAAIMLLGIGQPVRDRGPAIAAAQALVR
jgi:NADH-quinone oxidoreductase subunit N